jgi:hypothetical protein
MQTTPFFKDATPAVNRVMRFSHNLAHRPARSAIMRLAQRFHLVCPPAHHWVHHRQQTIHYCVVNGWANYLCDGFYVWRGLERVIAAVTGLVPRADDLEWQRNYR